MILEKFRSGLLGRFVKFGVVPSVLVVVTIVGTTTYLNIISKFADLRELATSHAEFFASKRETGNQTAIGTLFAMSLALENGLYANKASTLDYLQSVAQANPMFGVFVAYESIGALPNNSTSVGAAKTVTIDTATDETGRFAPRFDHDPTAAQSIQLRTMNNVSESVLYKTAMQNFANGNPRKIIVTEPHMSEGEMVNEFVLPISIDGKFAGVAGITRPFSVAVKSIKDLALEHEMNYLLLTDKDVFVAAYAGDPSASEQARATFEGLSGKPLEKTEWATSLGAFLGQSGNNFNGTSINPTSKTESIHALVRVAVTDWKVVVEIPRSRFLHDIWEDMWVDLLVGVGGILIMGTLILRTATNVVGEVSGITVGISSTAIEMSGSSRQQESVSQSFGASSVEIAAAVRQITVTGTELLRKMETIAKTASQSSQNASEGRVGVQIMGTTMEGLAKATTNVAERLSMIFEKASSINSIVDVITKVSDQTNLLSVNAAIEAEKAGDSGRGFLVVAREIRRLADQTAAATLDIEKNVQQMQAVVSGGVMEMDRFSEQVRRGVTNVGEVGQRLTKVIDQVGSVESSFSEVTEGMQSQVQGADQIRQAMDALTQNASRAQEATSEFSQSAAALRESIMSLRKVIGGDMTA